MPRPTAQGRLSLIKESVIHGYNSGVSLRELSRIYGATPSSLYRFLISNGVTMRGRGRPRKKENSSGNHEQTL